MSCLDADPFLQANNLWELGKLIEKTGDDGCSSNEFACGDDDFPVCVEMDDDNWQSVFLDELTNDPENAEGEENSDHEIEDDSAEQEVLPRTKSLWVYKTLYSFYNKKETPKKL